MKSPIPRPKALSGVLLAGFVAVCLGSCYSSLPVGKGNGPQQESMHPTIASLSEDPLGLQFPLQSNDDPAFELTLVDTNCTYYATFQSHNQKVVQNANGIFMTYLLDYTDVAPWPGTWRLVRSTDGGTTFQVVYTSPLVGSKTACIETDEDNNILAVCSDETDPASPFLFHRFLASKDYKDPQVTKINNAASGKYSMMYASGKVYLFNHYGKFFIINATTGRLIGWKQVVEFSGQNATTQYPHIYIDETGLLHHAWTTNHKERYLYWDIHYTNSPNEGEAWYKADGTRIYCPMLPDQSGKADQIILPDEFEAHTWLSNMIAKNGKVHFAYLAQTTPPREHYVRIDLVFGQIDKRIFPEWKGETISIMGLDGFFATGPGTSPLYYIGRANQTHIGALVSHDNGETWHDLALSQSIANGIYSIGGCRFITPDDYIIGSFTSQYGSRGDPYFFRIKVGEGAAVWICAIILAGLWELACHGLVPSDASITSFALREDRAALRRRKD